MADSQGALNLETYKVLDQSRSAALQVNQVFWRDLKSYADAGDDRAGRAYGRTGQSWFVYQIGTVVVVSTTLYETTGAWRTAPNAGWVKAAELGQWMVNLRQITTQLTRTDVR